MRGEPVIDRSDAIPVELRDSRPRLLDVADVDGFARSLVQRGIRVTSNTIYARIKWHGVNGEAYGEVYPVRLSSRVMRRVRFYQRHPWLCRQFYPRRLRKSKAQYAAANAIGKPPWI
jgi:hypothetical protein